MPQGISFLDLLLTNIPHKVKDRYLPAILVDAIDQTFGPVKIRVLAIDQGYSQLSLSLQLRFKNCG